MEKIMNNEKEALRILIKEYFKVASDITKMEINLHKTSGLLGGLIAIIFSIGFGRDQSLLFLIIPLITLVVIYYYIFNYDSMAVMGAYGAILERKINSIVDDNVLNWESKITVPLNHRMPSIYLLYCISLILLIFLNIISIYYSFLKYPGWTIVILIIVIFFLILAAKLLINLSTKHEEAQEIIERLIS
jgi:hypothetical protein